MCQVGSRSSTGRVIFEENMCWPVVMYVYMSALLIVCLLLRANAPALHMQWTNAVIFTMGDKTEMRSFAKFLWTLVLVSECLCSYMPRVGLRAVSKWVSG